jgi:hypothetical protein
MIEEWKEVIGWGDYYYVSNLGRVKSLERQVSFIRKGKLTQRVNRERILKACPDKDGYMCVVLFAEGKKVCKSIHRMVAESFIQKNNSKGFVNHKDGVKNNNLVSNLEWVTAKENTYHALKNELRGVKVNNEMYYKIQYLYNKGFTYNQLSSDFELDYSTVWRIINEPTATWRLGYRNTL